MFQNETKKRNTKLELYIHPLRIIRKKNEGVKSSTSRTNMLCISLYIQIATFTIENGNENGREKI